MTLYCDMDGVLANFDKAASEILGVSFGAYCERYGENRAWAKINDNSLWFWGELEPMPDATALWEAIKHVDPIILTALPLTNEGEALYQKIEWIRYKPWLGPTVPIIGVAARVRGLKARFCHKGDTLIDDMKKYRSAWEAMGGLFIEHKSAARTIALLEKNGVIE